MIFNNPVSFIHVPKTAGLSIGEVLKKYGVIVFEHKHHRVASSISGDKISFVRNPFDRLLSAYCFMRSTGKYDLKHNKFSDFVMNVSKYKDFVHVKTQSYWIDSKCSFIGKFENLKDDMTRLCNMLDPNKTVPKIPWLNRTCHRPFYDVYDHNMIDAVVDFYYKDFKRFGYNFTI